MHGKIRAAIVCVSATSIIIIIIYYICELFRLPFLNYATNRLVHPSPMHSHSESFCLCGMLDDAHEIFRHRMLLAVYVSMCVCLAVRPMEQHQTQLKLLVNNV